MTGGWCSGRDQGSGFPCVHMAPVAQLAEHQTGNPKVVGSNPTRSEVFGLRSSTLSPVVITPEIISKGKLLEFERIVAGIPDISVKV